MTMSMYQNAGLLKDLCIDFMCDNIEKLYTVTQVGEVDGKLIEPEFTFVDSNAYLPMEVAEKLLTKLSMQDKLNDEILSVFNVKNVCLRYVILPNSNKLTTKGLKTLKEHKIKVLETHGLNCTIHELISSLSEWTIEKIETLCVSNILFTSGSSDNAISFSKLKNLRSLNVSNTMFNTSDLNAVVEHLPYLESLDISSTKVVTILRLEKKMNQLKKLNLYNLNNAIKDLMESGLLKSMTSLTHLDLSLEKNSTLGSRRRWLQFLSDPDCLPNLVSLDVSGSDNVGPSIMEDFLTTHKKLTFLGLMHMEDAGLPMFTYSTHPLYNPNLDVTGLATKEQLIAGLLRYTNRPNYIVLCLENLKLYLTPSVDINIIQLILYAMNCTHESSIVQMAAFRCLCKLIKDDDPASRVHTSVLSKVVKTILNAMERFTAHDFLQMNSLSMLSMDCLSKNVKKADAFRCLKLILNSLRRVSHLMIHRRNVFICNNLVDQLSVNELFQLTSTPRYISILLSVVCENLYSGTINSCLRDSFLTIFKLSDLCSKTCTVFMDLDGLEVYSNALKSITNDIPIIKSVLGLLNNIALVPSLRKKFLKYDFLIFTLRCLFQSEDIGVRYLAVNIIENLLCEPAWELCYKLNDKSQILEELRCVARHWVNDVAN